MHFENPKAQTVRQNQKQRTHNMTKIYKLLLTVTCMMLIGSQLFAQTSADKKASKQASLEVAKLALKKSDGKIWFEENKGQFPAAVLYGFRTRRTSR